MSPTTNIAQVVTLVNTIDRWSKKTPPLFSGNLSTACKNVSNDQPIVETSYVILRYTRPVNMSLTLYESKLYAKSSKVPAFCNKSNLNDIFIKDVDPPPSAIFFVYTGCC